MRPEAADLWINPQEALNVRSLDLGLPLAGGARIRDAVKICCEMPHSSFAGEFSRGCRGGSSILASLHPVCDTA
jgi:hypothetical protein